MSPRCCRATRICSAHSRFGSRTTFSRGSRCCGAIAVGSTTPRRRMNELPLGAGAIAGTTFDIDRHKVAEELGFDRPMANSMDATASRDFLAELASALAITAVHLSRIGEEIVLWSSQEFGFVELDDAFATGSSMMPQKKNPDAAELVRGKSARVIGDLVALLTLEKGLPLGYNRDLQEDKTPIFDAVSTVAISLEALAGALLTASFRTDRMRAALGAGYVTATEVADFLAARGVPFREAHEITGQARARGDGAGRPPARGAHRGDARISSRARREGARGARPRGGDRAQDRLRLARGVAGQAGHCPRARNPGPIRQAEAKSTPMRGELGRRELLGLGAMLAHRPARADVMAADSGAPIAEVTFETLDLKLEGSPDLSRRALVLVPSGLAPGARVPALVLLHGLGETTNETAGVHAWVERYGLLTA